jgi:protein-S-isoprenylcysteine O-methyltransferase Ste14
VCADKNDQKIIGFNMLKLKIPPPIYLLMFGGIMWLIATVWLPGLTMLERPWNFIGFPFMGLALLMDLVSLFQFFRVRTTPNPLSPERASELVTKGMYRFSRNPMYVGLFFWLLGWGLYLGNFVAFLVLPAFVYVLTEMQIKPEEVLLEKKFGQAYLDYMKRVRRWL